MTRTTRRRRPVRWSSTVTIAVLALVWFVYLAPVELGGATSYIRISGESMEPTYYTGDLVMLRERDNYRVGDIVAFRAQGGIVIHRIIGGDSQTGFTMQGDNNSWIDPWQPTDEHIVGEAWVHTPGAGEVLQTVQQPSTMGMVAGTAVGLSLLGTPSRRRRRRDSDVDLAGSDASGLDTTLLEPTGSTVVTDPRQSAPSSIPSDHDATIHDATIPSDHDATEPRGAARAETSTDGEPVDRRPPPAGHRASIVPAAGAAVLSTVLLSVAAVGWLLPTTETSSVERPLIAQETSFSYVVHAAPSTLYPGGVIGPVSSGTDVASVPPIYTLPTRAIDVDYDVSLSPSESLEEVAGSHHVDLVISAPDGWSHTVPLAQVQKFEGVELSGQVSLDVAEIQAVIAAVEAESGFVAGTYELAIRSTVDISAIDAEGTAIAEQIVHELTFEYDETQILPGEELRQTEELTTTDVVERARRVEVLSVGATVATLRWLIVPGLVVAAVAAAMVLLLHRSGRWELAMIRARFNALLVDVEPGELNAAASVRVRSINDLARIAKRDAGVILHIDDPAVGHRFVVQDGRTAYEYLARSAAS
ncbi:MAG: signal peptidase I [Acidimicrobiia bacterium]|nr:signal peptidase I [Acidimicrobiia bacterium]